jgi:hypothetical protein
LVRPIFSSDVAQAAADGDPGDVVVAAGDVADDVADDVGDDAAPGEVWLPHAVKASPHTATAKTPRVTVRPRAAVPVGPQSADGRARGSLTA